MMFSGLQPAKAELTRLCFPLFRSRTADVGLISTGLLLVTKGGQYLLLLVTFCFQSVYY